MNFVVTGTLRVNVNNTHSGEVTLLGNNLRHSADIGTYKLAAILNKLCSTLSDCKSQRIVTQEQMAMWCLHVHKYVVQGLVVQN